MRRKRLNREIVGKSLAVLDVRGTEQSARGTWLQHGAVHCARDQSDLVVQKLALLGSLSLK